jgi:transposase-like protein
MQPGQVQMFRTDDTDRTLMLSPFLDAQGSKGGFASPHARACARVERRDPPARRPPGRPTKYRPEYCRQANLASKLGATDEELAMLFGVNAATLYRWQKAHPEFREAIQAGKLVADMKVAASLHSIAMGFEYEQAQAIKLKEVHYGADGKKVRATERVEIVKVRRILPPDTAAIMFWLTNRQKDKWKYRVSNERTGKDGGAVQVEDVSRPAEGFGA